MNTQFITDNLGNKLAVILPIKEYEKLLEKRENDEAESAYTRALKRKHSFKPAAEVFKSIESRRKR